MEVNTHLGIKFSCIETSMEIGGSKCNSKEVNGSFHGNTWNSPVSVK